MSPKFFALIAAVALVLVACSGGGDKATSTPSAAGTVDVSMTSFKYTPSSFSFKAGNTVTFNLKSTDIPHTFTVKDLGIDWLIEPGKPQTMTAPMSKAGTFRVICTIPGHEGAGMSASFTVR